MKRRELVALSTAAVALTPAVLTPLRELRAQTPPSTPAPAAAAPPAAPAPASPLAAASPPPFTAAQLDQMLAPIALYPDALLSQTLMAATYPLEVVEAARWSKANPNLKGDAAVTAVKDKGWDVSVTSLVAFPQVLAMMNSKLDWTQKVGDAMIAQQSDVAASIQRLRAQAQTAGNLKSTPQMKVTTQPPSAGAPAGHAGRDRDRAGQSADGLRAVLQPGLRLWLVALSRLSADLFPPPPNYGYRGAAGRPGVRRGCRDRLRLLRRLELGRRLGRRLGLGRLGWLGPRQQLHHHQQQRHLHQQQSTIDHPNHNGHWNHDPAHRHGVPYRDPPAARSTASIIPTPASARPSAAGSTARRVPAACRAPGASRAPGQTRPGATDPRQ